VGPDELLVRRNRQLGSVFELWFVRWVIFS
jgi:hypothetical protein